MTAAIAGDIKIDDSRLLALVNRIVKPCVVRVGILTDSTKSVREGLTEEVLSLVEVAYRNEFGDPANRIPQRSFIRAWVDENTEQIDRLRTVLAKQVYEGKINSETAMQRFGAWCVGGVQRRMAAGIPPPNAERTIREKGSSTPLIDTGQLRSSITWAREP